MQFDLDLIRAILLQVEKGPAEGDWAEISLPPGIDDEQCSLCVQHLHDAGYIEAIELWTFGGDVWKPVRLTWQSQPLLDGLRNDHIWEKAKALVAAKCAAEQMGTLLESLKNAFLSFPADSDGT